MKRKEEKLVDQYTEAKALKLNVDKRLAAVSAMILDTLGPSYQGRNFLSCSHCQKLRQQASWLLIGCTRVNNQSEVRLASLDNY